MRRTPLDGFSTKATVRITGVSNVTLENWRRTGFLSPSLQEGNGPGTRRTYSFRDIVAIRVVSELRAAGVELENLKHVVAYLRRRSLSATADLASTSLVSSGLEVFEVDGNTTISDLRRSGRGVVHVLPLDAVVREVQREARSLSAA